MGSLIKAREVSNAVVRRFHDLPETAHLLVAVEDPNIRVIAELRAQVVQLEERLRDSEVLGAQSARSAAEEALATGIARGRCEIVEDLDARHRLFSAGIDRALDELGNSLIACERVAIQIARDALELLFCDPARHGEILIDLIRKQVAALATPNAVTIEVSSSDFPTPADVERLRTSIGSSSCLVVIDSRLEAGQCRLLPGLGSLDVGIDQQWGTLRHALTRLGVLA